jgi:hypothetical protein
MLYPYVKDINMEKITSNDLYETLGMEKIWMKNTYFHCMQNGYLMEVIF